MENNTLAFPICTKMVDLFRRTQQIDDQVCLQESLGEITWSEPEDIPSGEDFEDSFKLQKSTGGKRQQKIILHCVIRSKKWLGDIKFGSNLLSYLNTNKIFMNYNKFETEETGSPGFLIELHPTLTNKTTWQQR
eukprot:12059637-Ditylum_brightwellii.AAC.2